MTVDPTTDPRFVALRTQARAVIGYFDLLRPVAVLVGVRVPIASELAAEFDRSEGVDLAALAVDAEGLRRAGDAADQAIADLRARSAAMTASWTGRSAVAAASAIDTHIVAATVSAGQVRAAKQAAEALVHAVAATLQTKYQNLSAIPSPTLLGQSLAMLTAADAERNSAALAGEITAKLALFTGATTRSHDAIRPMLTTLNDTLAQVAIPHYPTVSWHRPAVTTAPATRRRSSSTAPAQAGPVGAQASSPSDSGAAPGSHPAPSSSAGERPSVPQSSGSRALGPTRAAPDPMAAIAQVLGGASSAMPAAAQSVTDGVGSLLNMVLHPNGTGDHAGMLDGLGHPGGAGVYGQPSASHGDTNASYGNPHSGGAGHTAPGAVEHPKPVDSSGGQSHSPKLNLSTDPVPAPPTPQPHPMEPSTSHPAHTPLPHPPPPHTSPSPVAQRDSPAPHAPNVDAPGPDSSEPDSGEVVAERADAYSAAPRGYPDADESGGLALAGDR